jgi:hypothetical protein
VQFLADESCDFAVVRALRAAGHDVTTAADLVGGADDTVVAGLAVSEARVILIRFPAGAHAVSRFGVRLVGSFVVVEPGRVRLGRPPRA